MFKRHILQFLPNSPEGKLWQDQPVSGDLTQGNFAVNQGATTPTPPTIASAATIAPTTALTFITGTVQVGTITPPLAGYHQVVLCFTDGSPGAFLTSGNIKTAYQPIQNRPITLHYDPVSAKYWVAAVV
jgi:hypothetical protein